MIVSASGVEAIHFDLDGIDPPLPVIYPNPFLHIYMDSWLNPLAWAVALAIYELPPPFERKYATIENDVITAE